MEFTDKKGRRCRFRPWTEADVAEIVRLINVIQPHAPFTAQKFKWLYRDCPHGKSDTFVVENDGKIVALVGLVRINVFIHGKERSCFQFNDAMVHPDYRMSGIYQAGVMRAMDRVKERNRDFGIVFPNTKSIKSIVDTGWFRVAKVPLIERDIEPEPPSASVGGGLEVRQVDRFDKTVDAIIDAAKNQFPIIIKRDSSYLNWRYMKKPGERYKAFIALANNAPAGYMVYKTYAGELLKRQGHMVDALIDNSHPDAAAALIRAAISTAHRAGTKILSCWMFPHPAWIEPLIANGFAPVETNQHFFCFFPSGGLSMEDVSTRTNWFLTMGDCDVF